MTLFLNFAAALNLTLTVLGLCEIPGPYLTDLKKIRVVPVKENI